MLEEGIITGREAYQQTLREALQLAATQGCRELWAMDADFAAWPLGEPEVLATLKQWALPHRKLRLLAAQYDDLRRLHPRFVDWRRSWDHVVAAAEYQREELGSGGPVGMLLAPGLFSLRLLDAAQWRAAYSVRTADEIAAREWFDAVWQRSSESFPASALGL
ncbi:hypothetical protein G8A07_16830 [Roseateles sp. DAIF2]|uniref:hypothetical protein n=1 Tax=Roseateles sp. DAIF2 TaxID=2714952 RepID=UPI0018A30389|nr:hypothetical protein [Roseateles sp. DAIF2]QPF74420.1 hypothetical protein G8A07_16830 [Roseateles sp. DAIF2]